MASASGTSGVAALGSMLAAGRAESPRQEALGVRPATAGGRHRPSSPSAWIECRPAGMERRHFVNPRSLKVLVSGALLALSVAGCSLKHENANLVSGKKLFVQKCGSCHTLSHAGT